MCQIQKCFREEGIEIPYPHVSVVPGGGMTWPTLAGGAKTEVTRGDAPPVSRSSDQEPCCFLLACEKFGSLKEFVGGF
jgi:hypothetical protein